MKNGGLAQPFHPQMSPTFAAPLASKSKSPPCPRTERGDKDGAPSCFFPGKNWEKLGTDGTFPISEDEQLGNVPSVPEFFPVAGSMSVMGMFRQSTLWFAVRLFSSWPWSKCER